MNIVPMEFNVVVEIDTPAEKTAGGIYLPTQVQDADKLKAEEGVLVAVSPHAFSYADWPEGAEPPRVGDRVLVERYAGVMREEGGKTFRILKDKAIMAILTPAAALAAAA